jgi:tape measure domain-containing protein
MAEYNINFSTNASQIAKELSKVQTELAKAVQMAKPSGLEIKLSLNTSQLEASINTTFRKLNKEIESNQRKLSRLQIGGGNFDLIAGRLGRAEGQKERGQLLAAPSRLRGQAEAFEFGSEIRSKKILESLRIQASQIAPNTVEWTTFQQLIGQVTLELKQADKAAESIQLTQQLGALAPGSLSRLDKQLTILKNRARDITPNTVGWKKLNKEIQKVETSIQKVSKKPLSAGQRAGAAGGAFLYGGGMGGGIGSAVGGIAGGIAGGVPGAFAGAAIGQVADNLGTALAGITSQAAAVQKMQRGLAMASVDAKDFAEAQAAVGEMSQKLLMPLEQTTKYFAQLRANTKEYNLSVADTKEILEGTALAIMATGGSAEDLDGAMRAVVQIMSKGGVQAEELRGQLGERFPGAVVKFAQANKMSFEELQAGLEAGTIGIREFINFAKKNYTDYAKFSEQLATAPEYAGQRLKIALEQISLEIGGLFGPMGADIQDLLTGTINNIAQFIKDNRAYLRQMISDFSSIVGPIAKVFVELMKVIANFSVQVGKIFQGLFAGIRQALGMASIGEAKARLDKAKAATAGKTRPIRNTPGGGTTTSAEFIELEAAQRAFSGMGGQAAFDKANAPAQPSNLTFGGAGAGMSIDRAGKEEKEKKKKADSLESFERLRDQLANAYNQAEIERIKARYELQKRLQEDMYDIQEFGANRLQRQNLQFLRALAKAEQDRQDTLMDAQLRVAEAAGKIAPSAPILPSAGGAGSRMSIVDVGKALQKAGFTVKEHPAFGGVTPGVHSPRGYHPTGEAIDVTDWRGGDWKGRTAGLKQAMGGVGFAERLGPGDKGHETHVHLAVGSGGISQEMFNKALATITGQGGIGAGAPRKVGSNESRDTMAGASVDIAQQNADIAERGSLLTKESAILKELGRYMQEVYNVPDLTLDNQLLKARNDLMEQGVDPNVIDHKMRLLELDIQYQHLLKAFPKFADDAKLSEEERIKILAILADALNNSTVAERAKNDETLRGTYIQERKRIADELAMAKSLTPDQELRTSIAQRGLTGERAETLFQEEKMLQGAQKLKADLQGIAGAIGDSFGEAFKGMISGSMTAQQALANLFQSVGNYFADMVAKMIAEWLKAQLIKGFANLFGSIFGGGGGGLGSMDANIAQYAPLPAGYANGGIAPGGFTAFANGGMVTGPTMGLVGEGRYNEAIVPLPDGKSIPVDLGGATGSQITSNIVVNVSSDGKTSSSGSGSDSAGLGRKLEGAVKQVIVDELRPGGLLSGRR